MRLFLSEPASRNAPGVVICNKYVYWNMCAFLSTSQLPNAEISGRRKKRRRRAQHRIICFHAQCSDKHGWACRSAVFVVVDYNVYHILSGRTRCVQRFSSTQIIVDAVATGSGRSCCRCNSMAWNSRKLSHTNTTEPLLRYAAYNGRAEAPTQQEQKVSECAHAERQTCTT